MSDINLLKKLKQISKNIMQEGKTYHDFAHVMGVYKNVEKLLKYEAGNRTVLLTAALFHDVKRGAKNHGTNGAIFVKKLLASIPEFPQNLIEPVAEIIEAHDKNQKTKEEKLFSDADTMDAFSNLGIIRSFMMYAKEGFSLENASYDYIGLIDRFYKELHTKTAKKLIANDYQKCKAFAKNLMQCYR